MASTLLRSELVSVDHPLLEAQIQGMRGEEITSWVKLDSGLIGFGIYKSHTIQGANRFAQARKWWHKQLKEFDVHDTVQTTATGPILFTSFSFDEEEDSILVIPKVIVGRRNGISWITWIGVAPRPVVYQAETTYLPLDLDWGVSDHDLWQNCVRLSIEKIKSEALKKVVLARSVTGKTNKRISEQNLLIQLASEYPTTWVFSNRGLVGATPELLIRLHDSTISSRVLAGTLPTTKAAESVGSLEDSLANSAKDIEEHQYAVRSVVDALSPFCAYTNVPETPFVLHLSNVMHLATDVTGVLSDSTNPADIFDLVSRLHPSAAVCGTPTELAKRTIDEIEGISRGRYAGPIGWIDAKGDGELGIALRCGQISHDGQSIRIYAGCGIVAGSDPEREYAESQAKLLPMRSALEKH